MQVGVAVREGFGDFNLKAPKEDGVYGTEFINSGFAAYTAESG